MPESSAESRQPAVSIILPTYNRARFLPQALKSIRAQEWTDWELIIVDDGSTDNTQELLPELTSDIEQPVQSIQQENQGPYGARNTGLDHARGKYIAFYDSDDEWLPHHLQDCVESLETNPDVVWVYGACRMVDDTTGEVLAPTTFETDDGPRPFAVLKTQSSNKLEIFDDRRFLHCVLSTGLYAGLQNSVMRASLFADRRFDVRYRNEAEDALFVARVALSGGRFGYLRSIHVNYHVHNEHSSAAGTGDVQKRSAVLRAMLSAFEDFYAHELADRRLRRAFGRAMADHYFWKLGYATYWCHGERTQALRAFRRAMRLRPFNVLYWKTYACSVIKIALGFLYKGQAETRQAVPNSP